jgi:hypothetical protein
MRTIKWFTGLALAWMVGSIPACGTMGGGGMKYLVDPPAAVAQNVSRYAG